MGRIGALFVMLLPLLVLAGEGAPPGKYRCYIPPAYTVTNWFELMKDGTYRPHEGASGRYVYNHQTSTVQWLDGFLAGKTALHIHPGPGSPGGSRHTLFFGADPKTTRKILQDMEQCYLTTH